MAKVLKSSDTSANRKMKLDRDAAPKKQDAAKVTSKKEVIKEVNADENSSEVPATEINAVAADVKATESTDDESLSSSDSESENIGPPPVMQIEKSKDFESLVSKLQTTAYVFNLCETQATDDACNTE
ncbi:unnamed protein product [Soboliphyme baturini]|uniref:Ribosomal_L12_N domain-containing protein n=1 Tax=Soboliphyme baturini TaxID=241478 RepID=A0A183IP74_9BILA|nr:unnamed protein product [Soboliphyme baturini]